MVAWEENSTSELLDDVALEVQQGNIRMVSTLVQRALDERIDPETILNDGLMKGLEALSIQFRNSEVFIAELLQASKALNVGVALFKDKLVSGEGSLRGTIVIATVEGDLHDIGKNIVRYVLQNAGFVVYDLGIDVPASDIVTAVREHKPDILALSAMLTTTMMEQKVVIEALEQAGLRDQVRVIVGGAPISERFCETIGADGYASDATGTVHVAKDLIEKGKARP